MTDETPALSRLLDAMEGLPMRHGMPVEAKHLYCDMCNEPIYPNAPAHLLWTERPVYPDSMEVPSVSQHGIRLGGMYLMYVSHAGCAPVLPLPCQGYLEFVVEASWGRDYRLSRPSLLAITNRDDGVPWDPVAAHNAQAAIVSGFPTLENYIRRKQMALSPQDIIFSMMVTGIDPRWVVDWETGEIVADDHAEEIREAFAEGVDNLLDKWRDDPPAGIRFGHGDPNVEHREQYEGDTSDVSPDEIDRDDE